MTQPDIKSVQDALIVRPGESFSRAGADTRHPTLFADKDDARASLKADAEAINELQDRLYAERNRSLLVILQGIDTAGKSGTIKSVFAETSPLGMVVKAFKAPTRHELARDYLWRVHNSVPPKGYIGIFDRSHYEDVLVVKVRKFAPEAVVEQRYEQINQFEKLLSESGTKILKIMLNVSREEQGERLQDRLDKPHKHWKFNPGDLEDRALWGDFMNAYNIAVSRCATEHAPWYVVPSDSKTRRNAMVARLVRGALEEMDPQWPKADFDFSSIVID